MQVVGLKIELSREPDSEMKDSDKGPDDNASSAKSKLEKFIASLKVKTNSSLFKSTVKRRSVGETESTSKLEHASAEVVGIAVTRFPTLNVRSLKTPAPQDKNVVPSDFPTLDARKVSSDSCESVTLATRPLIDVT